jgi:hypothetical protein
VLVRVAQPQHRLARLAARVVPSLLLASAFSSGCGRAPSAADSTSVRIEARLVPPQPTVGPATLTVTLSGGTAETLGHAAVDVVGHMTHPGMTPVVATVTRRGPDIFDAALDLNMPGDWQLVATARFPDSPRIEARVPVRVQPRQP